MAYLPRLSRTSLWTALLFLLAQAQALAADITAVRSWRAPDNTRLVFDLSGPVKFQVSPDSTPARLVVDIDGARPAGPLALPAAQAPLKALRLEPTAHGQRLVIETAVELMPKVFQLTPNEKYGHRLVLDLYEKNSPRLAVVAPATGAVAAPAGAVASALPDKAMRPAEVARPAGEPAAKPAEQKPAADKTAMVSAPAPATGPAAATSGHATTTATTTAGAAGATPASSAATAAGTVATGTAAAAAAAAATTAPAAAASTTDKAATDKAAADKTGKPARPGERELASLRLPQPEAAPEPATPEKYDARRYRNIIVAIDAGHGGEDPGAIGQNGTHEKNVTLAIARELQARLEAEPGITAVLTRTGDYFIPLQDRRRIARYQHKADIFVSIHADSAPSQAARGASVFALSLKGAGTATSRFARMLAERENRADLIGGAAIETEDNVLRNVLADMVVAGSLDHSLHMGRNILSGLGRIGSLHSRNVEQAGFAVLKEPGMVSLLVETGFISNPEEEKKLISRQHQQEVAAAVAAGVRRYCQQYPAPSTYFAWLAERGRAVAGSGRRSRDSGASATAAGPAAQASAGTNSSATANSSATSSGGDNADSSAGAGSDTQAAAAPAVVRVASARAMEPRPARGAEREAGGDSAGRRRASESATRFVTHRVGPGESLTRLSDRYGVSLARLRESNGLRDDNIRIGQTLKIPRD